MLDLVVMEQFVKGLPDATTHWDRYHSPIDQNVAVKLVEDLLATGQEYTHLSSQPTGCRRH